MSYIDGSVCPVLTAKKAEYVLFSQKVAALFKEYGAETVVDCWGDDVPDGKLTSFPLSVQKTADETVVFSWVSWPDKATRDAGWEKLMADPRMKAMDAPPFDGKRMIYGGFQTILEA